MNSLVRPMRGGLTNSGLTTPIRAVEAAAVIEVSVIMVIYHTGPVLKDSIARVLADPSVGEFVLIDNGSTAAEAQVQDAARRQDARVLLQRGHGNVGFARGANMGAGLARGRTLIFLNPDALLQPGCTDGLVRALKAAPSPRMVGARVMNVDGTEQRGSRRGEVTPVTTLLSLTRLSHHLRALHGFEIHHEHDPEPSGVLAVPTISGACFAMTRRDYVGMGGLDEGYFLHVEDVDLCWRVRQSGGAVLFSPGSEVVHLGSTSHTSPIKVEFFKGLGLIRYFHKRADNKRRKMLATVLAPLIILVSVGRAISRPHRRLG